MSRPLKNETVEMGLKLLVARRRADIGQAELARRTGFTVHTISRWERGMCRPKPGKLRRIAVVLGCDLHDLLPDRVVCPEGSAT